MDAPLPRSTLRTPGNEKRSGDPLEFSYAGSRFLLGYLGGPFSTDSTVVAESVVRHRDQIRIVFRYEANLPVLPRRNGDVCFFAATLDEKLPDGIYDVTVELKNLPAKEKMPAIQRLQFQKPDPRFQKLSDGRAAIKQLSSAELFDRYCAQAVEMKGMIGAPREGHLIGTTFLDFANGESQRLGMLKAEIIQRGLAISPLLIDALMDHAEQNPDILNGDMPPLGIARELMDMLTQIGDARAANVMNDVLSGKLRCNAFVVRAAIESIEKLTLIRFRKFAPHNSSYAEAVRGDNAIVQPMAADVPSKDRQTFGRELAAKYDKWIGEHPADGSDITPWKKESVRMARKWLGSDDLDEAYNAATFLRSGMTRPRIIDDDPARTTRRIADILEQCEMAGSEPTQWGAYYTYRHKPTGKALPVSVLNWVQLLTAGRAVSPEYAALIIRIDREMPQNTGSMSRFLNNVGGAEAMAYRIEAYWQLIKDLSAAGIDPTTNINALRDRNRQTVWHCQIFRWGIERWAGRTFSNDNELNAWWSAELDKTQAQWLETNLPLTAAKADAGDRQSQYLLRVLLGGTLPNTPTHSVWLEPGHGSDPEPRAEEAEPFRVKWLADHAGELSCDAERGVFVMRPTAR